MGAETRVMGMDGGYRSREGGVKNVSQYSSFNKMMLYKCFLYPSGTIEW